MHEPGRTCPGVSSPEGDYVSDQLAVSPGHKHSLRLFSFVFIEQVMRVRFEPNDITHLCEI